MHRSSPFGSPSGCSSHAASITVSDLSPPYTSIFLTPTSVIANMFSVPLGIMYGAPVSRPFTALFALVNHNLSTADHGRVHPQVSPIPSKKQNHEPN